MRWLYSAVVGAGLVLAVAAITPGEVRAQVIRPRPVYPEAQPGYSFSPGQNYQAPSATLYSRPSWSMPYGDPYGPYGPYGFWSPYGLYGIGAPANLAAGMYSSEPSSNSQAPQGTPTVEVTMYDNSFVPSVLYVSPGEVVRWTNTGQHRHTVTSDTGLWDSGELGPGEGYAVYFPLRGRYYYHCKLHGRDMRGWVVVESGY
jgi:plastocyanin